jgi:hypothetical protein
MAPSMLCAESQTCSGSLLNVFRSSLTAGARIFGRIAVKKEINAGLILKRLYLRSPLADTMAL